MLCTASVEEVICDHYKNQLDKLGDDEKDLKKSIKNLEKMKMIIKIAYDEAQLKEVFFFIR